MLVQNPTGLRIQICSFLVHFWDINFLHFLLLVMFPFAQGPRRREKKKELNVLGEKRRKHIAKNRNVTSNREIPKKQNIASKKNGGSI